MHTLAQVAVEAAANEEREAQVLQQQQQQQQQQEEQQTATAIETGDGNIIITGEDGQGKD